MPEILVEKENRLSLVSIEVLISHVQIDLNIECHLPCIVFRLLDYPAVSIPYFDQWLVEDFHNLKKDYPNISWRQLLSDQFYELRSANGKFKFNRGKSCLFKTYFKNLYSHLLNVPLFLLLTDQIHDSQANKSHFIGSCNVKLNELVEILNQSIIKHGNDIPLVEQQTFHTTLFNLMGTEIGTCDIAVRFCHYGTTILTHFPMLNDEPPVQNNKKVSIPMREELTESSTKPTVETTVKHIHFVNEKKDIGVQLFRSDLPLSNNSKSAQTRWTSTKTRSSDYLPAKGQYQRTVADPSLDDQTVTFYQPPPLYFNSDSDFLQMMTPSSAKIIEKAKENRLSYLATIPIASFDAELNIKPDDGDGGDDDDNDAHEKHRPKRKTISLQSNLPSSITSKVITQTKHIPQQNRLAKDFLHNFPLLRSLVEEALALQQCQSNMQISRQQLRENERSHSSIQRRQNPFKIIPVRPKTAVNTRSNLNKSFIVAKNINSTNRLHPLPSQTNYMAVTKTKVRDLVDRLAKPKFNKRVERELTSINPNMSKQESVVKTQRLSSKPVVSTFSNKTVQKPPLVYGTTRTHQLMVELSRARRAAVQPQASSSPKSQKASKKEPTSTIHIPHSPPTSTTSQQQKVNMGAVSNLSLLNKVDVESPTTGEKNTTQRLSSEKTPDNRGSTLKSTFTTNPDVSLRLNQTTTKITYSTPESTIPQHNQENDERNDDLDFSITDITDYFTDGGESSTRPPTRQSTT